MCITIDRERAVRGRPGKEGSKGGGVTLKGRKDIKKRMYSSEEKG